MNPIQNDNLEILTENRLYGPLKDLGFLGCVIGLVCTKWRLFRVAMLKGQIGVKELGSEAEPLQHLIRGKARDKGTETMPGRPQAQTYGGKIHLIRFSGVYLNEPLI